MAQYRPNQIDDASLNYYYTSQPTQHGVYYRLKQPTDRFPAGFYAAERVGASTAPQITSSSTISGPSINISIVVFVGEPLDYQKYRHTALCLRPSNAEAPLVIHIIGPNMAYEIQTRDQYEPTASTKFAKEVQVKRLTTPSTKAQLASIICQTPINNSSQEFNCQLWVGDALIKLAQAGHLTQEECDNGISGMVDATMEAEDDET